MAASVDVGSVLGGRYKVTAQVLQSAEHDSVLEGIDQVLNRPISILVAGPQNAAHLSQGAREVATGERQAALQILDLGTSDGTTYLITSQSSAADLLDLLVPTEPYVEPFFTDTLGQEIFGQPRPDSPVPDSEYVYEDDSAADIGRSGATASGIIPPPPQNRPSAASKPTEPEPVELEPEPVEPVPEPEATEPEPVEPERRESEPTAAAPKVSLWNEDDYGSAEDDRTTSLTEPEQGPATATPVRERKPSSFPAAARAVALTEADPEDGEFDDDDENRPRTGSRLLVGAVVAAIIVAALIFAVTQISSLVGGQPAAAPSASSTVTQPSASATPSASTSATPAPATVSPVIANVTRLVGGDDPSLYSVNDPQLPKTFDGNPATTWSTYEFSNDSFANQTSYIALAVDLKEVSDIRTVTITQLGGTGGSFQLLANSKPAVAGGTEIGTGSFTGQAITISVPAGTKAKDVIIKFNQLPKLTSFRTYPYGIKVAEISIK